MSIDDALGGSFASSVHGVARPTHDLDFVAAILPAHAVPLEAALREEFYIDAGAIRASFPVISAEDIALVKLRRYRDGGESSESDICESGHANWAFQICLTSY
jgi:hypothetical protein